MKILLTVHQFPPAYSAGTEVLTLAVAKELTRRGHEVCVFTGHPSAPDLPDAQRFDQYAVDGIPIFRFHHAHAPMNGQQVVAQIEYDNHLARRHFAEVVAKVKPDVIHFFHFARLGATLVDVARAAGVRMFYTPTDFWAICVKQQMLLPDGSVCGGPTPFAGNCVRHLAIERSPPVVARVAEAMPDGMLETLTRGASAGWLPRHRLVQEAAALSGRKDFILDRLNSVDRIFAPTQLMADSLRAHGVRAELIDHVPYGIDIPAGVAQGGAAHGGPVRFGFIGTLLPHKGCHVLVEAFRRIDPSKARLKVYGSLLDSPEYVARLKALAQGTAIEFCGTFPIESIAQVLSGIDALVVPSLWLENTPLVVYAALGARRPVIASDVQGMTEVVQDGRNGLVFRPGEPDALLGTMLRLIDEPGLLAALAANCEPPKSTAHYVTELLRVYNAPQTREESPSELCHG